MDIGAGRGGGVWTGHPKCDRPTTPFQGRIHVAIFPARPPPPIAPQND